MNYNSIRKTVLVIISFLIISASFANAAQPDKSPTDTTDKTVIYDTHNNLDIIVIILIPLVTAVIGASVGAATANHYFKKRAEQEYVALILAFCAEMVSIFCRCVAYYNQAKIGTISYSALFSFTDSSALSKFASVCQKPAVVAAIVELKFRYFQIHRHVEEASRLAVAGNLASTKEEQDTLMVKAVLAQRIALAFFTSPYEAIEKEMDFLVNTTKEVAPGTIAEDLYSRYSKAKSDKEKIDQGIAV
jgi:hypothetical protein